MSHDFAKPKKKKSNPAGQAKKTAATPKVLPGWVWFLAGVLLTLFVQFLLHLASESLQRSGKDIPKKPNITWPKKTVKEQPKPIIQFYDTLKEQEVTVAGPLVKDRDDGEYGFSLQAGAFRKKQDAEQLRAELILLGLDTNIRKTISGSGSTWYRIIVGPFNSRSLFAHARSILLDNDIHPIRVKKY